MTNELHTLPALLWHADRVLGTREIAIKAEDYRGLTCAQVEAKLQAVYSR